MVCSRSERLSALNCVASGSTVSVIGRILGSIRLPFSYAGAGKASFDAAQLIENVRAFVGAVAKSKPSGSKGTYMKKISLSSTMGAGVTINVDSAIND